MVKKLVLKDKVSEYQEVESAEEALDLFTDNVHNKVLGHIDGSEIYVLLLNMEFGNYQWINVDTLVGFVPMSEETLLKRLESLMNKGELLIFDDIAEAKNYKGA